MREGLVMRFEERVSKTKSKTWPYHRALPFVTRFS